MDTTPTTYTLTPEAYRRTVDKIGKVNARAARRGFTGRFEVIGERVEKTRTNELGLNVTEIFYSTTITGTAPCYGGWTFLAKLDWDPHAGLIVSTAPGVQRVDRSELADGKCDHCRTNRYRRHTFLLADQAGQQVQVGRTCLKDFLGWDGNPVWFDTPTAEGDEAFGFGAIYSDEYGTETVIAAAWASIKMRGYHPASGYDMSTKEHVRMMINPPQGWTREDRREAADAIAQAQPMAGIIRTWVVQELTGDSEYVRNLCAAAAADHCTSRTIGLLASAPQAWAKAQERDLIRRREQKELDNTWAGQVGDKVELVATVKSIRGIDGNWGTIALYTLTGDDNRVYKWFSSNWGLGEGEGLAGTRFRLRGTIKKLDEYQGTRSTVLTRCKVLEELETAADELEAAASR